MKRAWTIGALCLTAGFLGACSSSEPLEDVDYEDLAVPTAAAAKADADEMITDETFEEEFERLQKEIDEDEPAG